MRFPSPFQFPRGGVIVLAAGATLLLASASEAQVVGRLRFSVKNAADEKPLIKAKIVLKDSANIRPDVTLTTDDKGQVESAPLDDRVWKITTEADTYQTDAREVKVVADTTTDVEVLLEPLKEKVIKITENRNLLNRTQTNTSTQRDRNFLRLFPSTAGNPQSLPDVVRTAPGFVRNSVNQVHPRGEHSSTAIVIDGFYLPGALQGRAGQILSPSALQGLQLQTGGYAPEFGGETGAILNLNLRSGPIDPFIEGRFQGGSYLTLFGNLTAGGQFGQPVGPASEDGGPVARRFRYLLDVTGRRTDNALEPPQPQDQDAHNRGTSQTYFANFDYQASRKDNLSLTVNSAPAYTQIANRTGLPDAFAPFGQGFGYGGSLSRQEARALGILSQDDAGQDINQRDRNFFSVLTWRRNFSSRLNSNFSLGGSTSDLDIRNNDPRQSLGNLPADSSIEFSPTILRSYRQIQPQGSLTYFSGKHTVKTGFLFNFQDGDESYRLVPGSQLALNALAATDRRLVPAGSFLTENGQPVLDRNGNQVYVRNAGARVPTLNVNRSGYYAAAYAQDTWNLTRRLTANYGLRFDLYRQEQNPGTTVDTGAISPRFNLAYAIDPATVARFSYNRLFTQPPLAQGAILGQAVQPQRSDQFDLSLERQFGRRQSAKVAFYNKSLRNFLDTGLLLEGTQIGAYTTVSLDRARVQGFELSYQLTPENNRGVGAYLTWANAISRPGGFTNTGEAVERFTDHDQLNTLNLGVTYTHRSGAFAGLDFYYGSGVASSVLEEDGKRNDRHQLNLSLGTGDNLLGRKGLSLRFDIENLTDDRSVINFASPFSGTRFQQGRRYLVSLIGRF